MRVLIVTPVYEDWESLGQLVFELDRVFAESPAMADVQLAVLAVHDGSVSDGRASQLDWSRLVKVERVEVLRMAMNMGHQRAIALGAVEAARQGEADAVVVMDADGEDRPPDVVRMVLAHREQPRNVILARRDKRSESFSFRVGYALYRLVFRLLTGTSMQFGNFSLVPRDALDRLVCNADIWNHFAAAVSRARFPVTMLPTERGTRYAGRSHMDWVSLTTHGLSAMSVYSDRVATRLILASALVTIIAALAVLGIVGIELFTDLAIPGWAAQTAGFLGLAALQGIAAASLLAFLTLQARQQVAFLPKTDGARYIQYVETWHQSAGT